MRRPTRKWLRRLGAGWVGAGLTIAASFWAGYNFNHWTDTAPRAPEVAVQATNDSNHATSGDAQNTGTVYVRRDGSVLRDKPEWSGHTLTHMDRGAAVALMETPHDGWAKVRAGDTVGWMRVSILGNDPSPKTTTR